MVSREGVFVKGSIKPPLSDVDVTLTSQHGGVLRVKTDQAGVYKYVCLFFLFICVSFCVCTSALCLSWRFTN